MTTEIYSSDHGTPEMNQRNITRKEVTSEMKQRTRVITSVPMDFYLDRGWVKLGHWDAAEQLYRFWYYGAEKSSYVLMRDPREPKGSYGNENGKMIMERKYNDCMRSIRKLSCWLMVYNVVCMGEWASDVIHVGVGKNARMERLKEGLKDIAQHLKIPVTNETQRKKVKPKTKKA